MNFTYLDSCINHYIYGISDLWPEREGSGRKGKRTEWTDDANGNWKDGERKKGDKEERKVRDDGVRQAKEKLRKG